jgi:hypothetical protein
MDAPFLRIKPGDRLRTYGCCRCQREHIEVDDPALFRAHLYDQSKHGVRTLTGAQYLAALACRLAAPR